VENKIAAYPEVNAVDRWWGNNRYTTSTSIASGADNAGFIDTEMMGVAAKLPDALTGGAMVGAVSEGPLVLTESDRLTPTTGGWITTNGKHLRMLDVYGGEKSITPATKAAIAASVP
jgi:hypothetical protein